MSHARKCACNDSTRDAAGQQSMKTCCQNAAAGRHANEMAATADARIRGHALHAGRVAQAIRDAKIPQKSARKRTLGGK